jgi:hypothetical protein
MANKLFSILFLCALFVSQAYCQSIVESCDLQNGHIVKLNQQLDETSLQNKFSLGVDGKSYPALLSYKGVPDLAVTGEIQFSSCVNNVFMLIVDTGSVRQPGVAVRFNAKAKKVEKIYFAQKGLPRFIQSDDAFAVIFNYDDYDEDAKFVRVTYKESANNTFHQEYLKDINESGLIKIPEPN